MILKRFASAIVRQDWTAVCVELVVVVLGIFLGLQADDWNQGRQARADEAEFMIQLHQDLVVAEQLSARVKQRRLAMPADLISAAQVLFDSEADDALTVEQCAAIAGSTYFNINVAPLPSYSELVGTGRLGIIADDQLRSALVKLQQAGEALATLIQVQTTASVNSNLGQRYPNLIKLHSRFDEQQQEIRSFYTCELSEMRTDQAFLNDFSIMADRYDAYVRDGLVPWSRQFEDVHARVDLVLGVAH